VSFEIGAGTCRTPEDSALLAKRHILVLPRGAVDLGDVPLVSANVLVGAEWIVKRAKGAGFDNVALRH
jgi:hypothetical protein